MGAPVQERKCVKCGRMIMWDANVCPYCGHDYRQPAQPMMPMMAPPKPKTVIPLIAGGLLIVTAVIWLVEAAMILTAAGGVVSWIPIDFMGMISFISGIIILFALIGIILAVIALAGGAFAMMRKHAGLAIIGAIFGLFAIGPWGIASILSLVALILLAVSHSEFE